MDYTEEHKKILKINGELAGLGRERKEHLQDVKRLERKIKLLKKQRLDLVQLELYREERDSEESDEVNGASFNQGLGRRNQ
jgi:hypothetical protein